MIYNILTIFTEDNIQHIANSADEAMRKLEDTFRVLDHSISDEIKSNLLNLKENSSCAIELKDGAELLIGYFNEKALAA